MTPDLLVHGTKNAIQYFIYIIWKQRKKSADSSNNYLGSSKVIPYYAQDFKNIALNEILNPVADL